MDAAKVATGMMAEQYIETKQQTLAEVRRVVSECSLISEEARRALLGGIEHV